MERKMEMRTRYVVIHGHIGRLLDEEDCKVVKTLKKALELCEADEYGDTIYLKMRVDKNVTEETLIKRALHEIW